ncbi:MAG: site-2 protease family protein [Armatimonadota bacterium]
MHGWRIGSIGGISVEINYTWLIIFGLFFVSLSTSWFPEAHPDVAATWHWVAGFAATILLFASVLAHELSHSFVAQGSGMGVSRITLFVFGGVAQMESEPEEPGSELRMAIAGPVMSFILAALFGGLWYLAGRDLGLGGEVLKYLGIANGFLGLFNLVPAFPLDGGRVLRSIIWNATNNLEHATRIASTVGQVFGFALMGFGFWTLLAGGTVAGLWYLALGWLLTHAAQSSYRRVQIQKSLGDIPVSAVMSSPVQTIPGSITLQQAVDDYFMKHRHGAFPVVDSEGRPEGLLELSDVKDYPPQERTQVTVKEAMEPIKDGEMTVHPGDDAADAMFQMAGSGRGRLLAIDEAGNLKGILSQRDIMKLVQIRAGLGGQDAA